MCGGIEEVLKRVNTRVRRPNHAVKWTLGGTAGASIIDQVPTQPAVPKSRDNFSIPFLSGRRVFSKEPQASNTHGTIVAG